MGPFYYAKAPARASDSDGGEGVIPMKQNNKNLCFFPTKHRAISRVVLFLPAGPRTIGYLDRAAGGIFTTSRTQAHVHRLTNSLGLNYELLHSHTFRWIHIDLEGQKLITTREYFGKKGRVLNFAKQGYELQIFLPLDQFGREKALEFERILPVQPGLFVRDAA